MEFLNKRVRVAEDYSWQPCRTGRIVGKYAHDDRQLLIVLDTRITEDENGEDIEIAGSELPPTRIHPDKIEAVLEESSATH